MKGRGVSDTGLSFEVQLLPDNTLRERHLSGGDWWSGNWELIGGILRMKIDVYELDIVANKVGNTHSGVEVINGQRLNAYFKIIHENQYQFRSTDSSVTRAESVVLVKPNDPLGIR